VHNSGKSYTAVSIAQLLDPKFTIDNIVFKGKELMKLINSDKLGPGSVIVWDEAGIDLSNRNWQSVTNKMLNALLQTFRHKNFILIFTVPYNDFIDSASRKLFHADFETQYIDKAKKEVIVKPKLLQYNANMGKWYRKYLKVQMNYQMVKIKRWAVPKATDELLIPYEEKKERFTKELNKDIDKQFDKLEPEETKEVVKEVRPEDTLFQSKLDAIDQTIWRLHKEGKSLNDIGKAVGFNSWNTIKSRLTRIKEKNDFITRYKNDEEETTHLPNLTSGGT
jgi:hypothetical protein